MWAYAPHRPFSYVRRRLYYLTWAPCTLSDRFLCVSLSSLSSRSGHALVGRHTRWRALMKSDGQYIASSILEMRDPSAGSGIRRPPLPHHQVYLLRFFCIGDFCRRWGKPRTKRRIPSPTHPRRQPSPLLFLFFLLPLSLCLSVSRRLLWLLFLYLIHSLRSASILLAPKSIEKKGGRWGWRGITVGAWLSGRFLRPPSPSVLTLLPPLMPVSAVALPLLLWGKKKNESFFLVVIFRLFCEIPFAARENLRCYSVPLKPLSFFLDFRVFLSTHIWCYSVPILKSVWSRSRSHWD